MVEQGDFVLREPESIHAIRFDGSDEARVAIVAMFKGDYVDQVVQIGALADSLGLRFPDGFVLVASGSWVWSEDHGYDVPPASVLTDDEFRETFRDVSDP